MNSSEQRLITFIAWSGAILGSISMLGYLIVGYWLDALYGLISLIFFASILYLTSLQRISFNTASLLFSSFGVVLVTIGYITSASVADGLIYMIIPTIIIALLRPFREAIVWLLIYYSVFLSINLFDIANHTISLNVFIQLFSIHVVLFLIISYYRDQEQIMRQQLEVFNGQLKKEVSIDALTGAYNRRAFRTMIDRALQQRDRHGETFVLAIIDIDYFKRVNDTYGHQKGDEVLQAVGKHLQKHIRQSDALIRYGGEEFVICFHDINLDQAKVIMEKIRHSIEMLDLLEKSNITISGGISALRSDDIGSSLMRRADKALYAAKASGRNAIFVEDN